MIDPRDFYQQLDWINEAWNDNDEYKMTRRFQRFRRLLDKLPYSEHRIQATELLAELERHRLVKDAPYQSTLLKLRNAIHAWDKARPAPIKCRFEYAGGIVCGLVYRSQAALADHLEHVHQQRSRA